MSFLISASDIALAAGAPMTNAPAMRTAVRNFFILSPPGNARPTGCGFDLSMIDVT